MARYKLTLTNVILDTEKGLDFPADAGNRHYQEYLAFLEAGGVPDPADPPPPPDEAQTARTGARQWLIDNPATAQIFTLSIPELETEIGTLIDLSFPSLAVANRTKWKKLVMALAVSVRVLMKRELNP